MMALSPPPADLTAYDVPTSLWSIVENNVPEHERGEVKSMLGEGLVEQSLELHVEAEMLLDIWRDYREETNTTHAPPKRLPEPPALRDRLKQEICFFVEQIREKSKRTGLDPMRVLARHNQDVLEYVSDQKRPGSSGYSSRPSSALSSRDGRETPLVRSCTPSSDRFSQTSVLSDEVERMNDKLNVLKLDEVVTHLRETLDEEITTLHGDIKFLQSCLDEEVEYRSTSSSGFIDEEPSLSELKEERNQLEKDLLHQVSPVPEVLREKPRNLAKHPQTIRQPRANDILPPISPGNNVPLVPTPPKPRVLGSESSIRPRTGLDSQPRPRTGPIKAFHQISAAQVLTVTRQKASPNRRSPTNKHYKVLEVENHVDVCDNTEHITVRTGSAAALPHSAKLVKVGSLPASNLEEGLNHKMSTQSGSRPSSRPSSATRFRQLVIGCREEAGEPVS